MYPRDRASILLSPVRERPAQHAEKVARILYGSHQHVLHCVTSVALELAHLPGAMSRDENSIYTSLW